MSIEILEALKALEREKGISYKHMVLALEEALEAGYKRNHPDVEGALVEFENETGNFKIYEIEYDEDGEESARTDVTPDDLGRLAAQTAKQVILQRLREAESDQLYDEYFEREGDIITGIVEQSDQRFTIVNLGRVEALLPPSEQVPRERYEHGARLKALILEVRKHDKKGMQVIVSRSHPGLLKRLFELEVPEIYDGYVEIKAVAREAGQRSKVAVFSSESTIDPVGACVGPKGSRVRMVVNELRGEKIDVVEWNEDAAIFVANALSPAEVKEVILYPAENRAEVVVPDDRLSLAIGKEGQNARLAAKLTGWRVDIKSTSQKSPAGVAPATAEPRAESDDIATGEGADTEKSADAGVKMCAATTSAGTPCKLKAKEGSHFCGRHQGQEAKA